MRAVGHAHWRIRMGRRSIFPRTMSAVLPRTMSPRLIFPRTMGPRLGRVADKVQFVPSS